MIKRVGIGIFILGLIISVVTTVNMVTRDEVVDIADNEVPRNEHTYMAWTPAIGLAMMLIGGGVIFYGVKREEKTTVRERR
jgi:uncharacterized YccA/Bax inhibitor family protein